MLQLPKATKGLLDGCKVSSAELVDIKFASLEAEDVEAAGKSLIRMVFYMDWILSTVGTLSRSVSKDDQIELQHLPVLGGRCLTHIMRNSPRYTPVSSQFLKDYPCEDMRTGHSLRYKSFFP